MNLILRPTVCEYDGERYVHYEFDSSRLERRINNVKWDVQTSGKDEDVSEQLEFLLAVSIGPVYFFNTTTTLPYFIECWCTSARQAFHIEEGIYVYEMHCDSDGSLTVFTLEEEIVPEDTLYGRTQLLDDLKFKSVAYLTPCKMRYMHLNSLLQLIEFVSLPIKEGGQKAKSFRQTVPARDMITVFKQCLLKMDCLSFISR